MRPTSLLDVHGVRTTSATNVQCVCRTARCVRVHVRVLRACGYWRRSGRIHVLYRGVTLAVTVLYMVQQGTYAVQARRDLQLLASVMFLLLCHLTSFVKQLVLAARADRVDALLASLAHSALRPTRAAHVCLLRVAETGARRLVHAYAGCAALTCLLWATLPAVAHVRGNPVQFPLYVGADYNASPATFWAVLAYSYYMTTVVAIANTTMDAFIATILLQCKTQLRILRMKLEELPESARELSTRVGMTLDVAFMRLLAECVTQQEKITEIMQMVQHIFGSAILIQFAISGWILCMAAYQIVNLAALSVQFASMVLFIVCILTELYLYCYYGNEVCVESARVCTSLYAARWYVLPARLQRATLLAMVRAQRPLSPQAGGVVPLSLHTFVQIIKSSYTFYAVLRQTK